MVGRPYNQNIAVSPDDSVNLLPYVAKKVLTAAVYVGATGDVVTVAEDDTAVTWKAVPSGTFLRIAIKRINATGTTALNLVACYWI